MFSERSVDCSAKQEAWGLLRPARGGSEEEGTDAVVGDSVL